MSLYLEMLADEGLSISLSSSPPPKLLPPCRETPWNQLNSLLDIPTLMFLAPQVSQVKGLLTFLFVKVFQHLKLIKPIKKRLVFARRLRSPKNEKLYMNVSLVSASVGRQLYHPVILGFDSLCEMYFHRRRCCLEDIQSTFFFVCFCL